MIHINSWGLYSSEYHTIYTPLIHVGIKLLCKSHVGHGIQSWMLAHKATKQVTLPKISGKRPVRDTLSVIYLIPIVNQSSIYSITLRCKNIYNSSGFPYVGVR